MFDTNTKLNALNDSLLKAGIEQLIMKMRWSSAFRIAYWQQARFKEIFRQLNMNNRFMTNTNQ